MSNVRSMNTPVAAASTAEIKARLEAVIRHLYLVAGPDDEMLHKLLHRWREMSPGTDARWDAFLQSSAASSRTPEVIH